MCYQGCIHENYEGECSDREANIKCNDTVECVVCGYANNFNEDFNNDNCSCYKCAMCDIEFKEKSDCYDDGTDNLCLECHLEHSENSE